MTITKRLLATVVGLVLTLVMVGPVPAWEEAGVAHFYRPVAQWSGRLIFPTASQRDADGSVLIEVHNSPVRELIGRTLRLGWDTSEPQNRWFEEVRVDVNMDPEEKAKNLEKLFVLPVRLDGLEKVSPLESLAGYRTADELVVSLTSPRVEGNLILVTEEPVQVIGRQKALVRFVGQADGNRRTVVHYDPSSGDFDGPEDTVEIPEWTMGAKGGAVPRSSTREIEESDLNEFGWYIFGEVRNEVFTVQALEPRRPFMLRPDRTVYGPGDCKNFISRSNFSNLYPGLARTTAMEPSEERSEAYSGGYPSGYMEDLWPVGTRGFMVHIFGWRSHPDEKPGPGIPGVTPGHLSFGMAEVVTDPFTGEPRFELTYRQVYANNCEAVVAGSQSWHAYMGDLKRGWMYTLPVCDTVIRIDELDPYDFDGWVIDPMKGLMRELETMSAVYRVGAGTGMSLVRPDISCVQDSHSALYSALVHFESAIAASGAVRRWIAGDPQDSEVKRFLRLKLLARDLKRRITFLGLVQSNWKSFSRNPLASRKSNAVRSFIDAIASAHSVFPRFGHDNILKLAARWGFPMFSVMTSQIGGRIPGLEPKLPTSTTIRR